MNAPAFAVWVHARRTGTGRWQGRCPAHKGRLPSLSIRDEPNGFALVCQRALN